MSLLWQQTTVAQTNLTRYYQQIHNKQIASSHTCSTHFLHEYLTGTPNAAAARLNGDPGGKSFFLPLYTSTVICKSVVDARTAAVVLGGVSTTKAVVVVIIVLTISTAASKKAGTIGTLMTITPIEGQF